MPLVLNYAFDRQLPPMTPWAIPSVAEQSLVLFPIILHSGKATESETS